MNIYTALRFQSHPSLHMTCSFHGGVKSPDRVFTNISKKLDPIRQDMRVFTLTLPRERWLGWETKLHTLVPDRDARLPEWVYALAPKQGWVPHVTCPPNTTHLQLTVSHLALMHKQEELFTWTLIRPDKLLF